ncbi:MAG: histidine kinase, partial [Bacteroidia bacterium]|nr:histidine kinase [Bacteroidia bacterium]
SYFDVVYLKVSLPIYKRSFFLPLIFTCLGLALASLIYFIYKNKQEQERYMQQLEESKYLKSQLLLSEMNPHFIFNVLTSIQNKIIRGDKEAANKKLIQLSALMRNFLSSSYKSNQPKKTFENEITLKREIDLLSSYLEFEQSISNDQFDYSLNYNSEINAEQIMIPPMIIQPYVENAVKHGILPKNEGGTIEVDFILSDEGLTCKIKDDGVGMDMKNSAEGNRKSHKSLGSQLVKERVRLLNSLGYNIEIKTESILGLGTEIHILILDKF